MSTLLFFLLVLKYRASAVSRCYSCQRESCERKNTHIEACPNPETDLCGAAVAFNYLGNGVDIRSCTRPGHRYWNLFDCKNLSNSEVVGGACYTCDTSLCNDMMAKAPEGPHLCYTCNGADRCEEKYCLEREVLGSGCFYYVDERVRMAGCKSWREIKEFEKDCGRNISQVGNLVWCKACYKDRCNNYEHYENRHVEPRWWLRDVEEKVVVLADTSGVTGVNIEWRVFLMVLVCLGW